MPIIESVQVASVAVPLDKVTSFATRTVSERHYCLVKVRGKDGNEGIGFCYVGSAGGDIAKIAVEQLPAHWPVIEIKMDFANPGQSSERQFIINYF